MQGLQSLLRALNLNSLQYIWIELGPILRFNDSASALRLLV